MLAAFSDLFAWYQIPLLVFFLSAWIFGIGAMLFIGGRYIAKSSKATYWWSVLTNIVAAIAGTIVNGACAALGGMASSSVESPAPAIITSFMGLVAGLLVVWLVIKAMFRVSYGKAILAWLPAFGAQFLITVPLLVSLLLPSVNRARELAKQAVCKTRLKGIGTALELYNQAENGYPLTITPLIEEGYASIKNFKCPSDTQDREISYFYLPPVETDNGRTFVMCDLKGNHKDLRNVLAKAGHVTYYSEEEFQTELAQPYNARFAEALKKAEGP